MSDGFVLFVVPAALEYPDADNREANSLSKFMVTGGAGFIGGHITEMLVGMGHEVVVFDDLSTGRESNLAAVADKIQIARGDIRDIDALNAAMTGVEFVVHHAAEISVIRSLEDPAFINSVNVDGTLNVLISAKDNGVKRVVFASSSAVYGDTGKTAQREDFLPQPLSPYGATKIAGEYYMSVFNHIYGLETVRLRYFNVFGPRQNPDSQYAAVIPKFISRIINGQELHIYGDGEQTRDFTYVANVVDGVLTACHAPGVSGEVINVATGGRTSLNVLYRALQDLIGARVEPGYAASRAVDVRDSQADITKAQRLLAYRPTVSFAEGLRATVEWYRASQVTIT